MERPATARSSPARQLRSSSSFTSSRWNVSHCGAPSGPTSPPLACQFVYQPSLFDDAPAGITTSRSVGATDCSTSVFSVQSRYSPPAPCSSHRTGKRASGLSSNVRGSSRRTISVPTDGESIVRSTIRSSSCSTLTIRAPLSAGWPIVASDGAADGADDGLTRTARSTRQPAQWIPGRARQARGIPTRRPQSPARSRGSGRPDAPPSRAGPRRDHPCASRDCAPRRTGTRWTQGTGERSERPCRTLAVGVPSAARRRA